MSDLYGGQPCEACESLVDTTGSSFSFSGDVLENALKSIYEKSFNPMTDIEENLFRETWKKFNQAADIGFSQAHYNPTDSFENEIRYNNAVFSAFRTHRMQNDIAAKLLDTDGKLKPFDQFAKDVAPITDHHVNHWMRTEYDTAVIRAHRAADWKQFEAEADVLPNLEWMESTSPNPGADHAIWWGTIRPINDEFWNKHKPGDRWNCKCHLQATDKNANNPHVSGKNITPLNNNSQPGLENNPADDGMIFSKEHPYYTNAYPGAEKAVTEFIKTQIPDNDFNNYKKFKNGGELLIHSNISKKDSDYKQLLSVGLQFAKEGKEVKLMPKLYYDKRGINNSDAYKRMYSSLIGTPYEGKSPDFSINGIFYELEGFVKPFKKSKISHMISNGAKQSPHIIIDNNGGASDRYILHNILSRTKDKTFKHKIDDVWVYEKGKVRLLYKRQ